MNELLNILIVDTLSLVSFGFFLFVVWFFSEEEDDIF